MARPKQHWLSLSFPHSSNTGAGTDTSSGSDSAPDAGSAAVPAGSGTSSGSDSGVDASSSNSAASEIMGIPSTYVYVFAGALALAVIAAVAFLLSKRRTNRHKHVAQSDDDGSTASEGSSSDSEAAHASHKSRKKRQSDSDTGDDDGTTARSLGALAAMEQAEHLAARQSVYAAAAKNEGGLGGLLDPAGQAAYRLPSRLFALSKQRSASSLDGSSSEDAQRRGAGRPYGEALL